MQEMIFTQKEPLPVILMSNQEIWAANDPHGIIIAIIGMGGVFLVLILLYVVFNNLSYIFTQSFKNKLLKFKNRFLKVQKIQAHEEVDRELELSGETNAAIAAAIYFYSNELHDLENTVLTIKKISRVYSPWNSKLYGLRRVFQ